MQKYNVIYVKLIGETSMEVVYLRLGKPLKMLYLDGQNLIYASLPN